MEQKKDSSLAEGRLYAPKAGEAQLSFRAVAIGCLLGGVVTSMNMYLGLKIGWTVGGSLMAAILGYAFFSVINSSKKFTVLEANITQTAGSGAGTMSSAAGFVSCIPAMKMLGYEIPVWGLFAWSLSVAYLGVMFSVPLRRQYVVVEKLRFPTGTATANTIMAMFATAEESVKKAKVLVNFGIFAFVYIVAAHFFHSLEHPPVAEFFESSLLATLATWGFSVYIGPMLIGAGLLIGPKIGSSLLAGAICGWGVLGYTAYVKGWAPLENPMRIHDPATSMWGARGWILWPGVSIMVADALMSLALSWRTFLSAFKGTASAMDSSENKKQHDPEDIPNSWWVIGLALGSLATVIVSWSLFGISPILSLLAIALSTILANVAVRSTGETDINPVGGMGKVTQGVFGALTDSMTTNLMSAGITGAGASQAADMMQDLKTGYMLGASPRSQFIAQLWGILSGVVFAVPVYLLFDAAWDIGGAESDLGAPAAIAWKAVAEVMSQGFESLPPMAETAMLYAAIFGASLPLIKKFFPKFGAYTPSGMAFGIAFIVHGYYSIAMFVGSMVLVLWEKLSPSSCGRFVFAVSCGLIAGEGLAGILNAILTFLGY